MYDWTQDVDTKSWAYRDLMGQPVEPLPKRLPRFVTASSNVNPLDDFISVTGNSTLTLETAVGCDGRYHTFIKTDSSATTTIIACTGSETIDGASSLSITAQYGAITVVSNGTNWNAHRFDLSMMVGTLGVTHGGTGLTTVAANRILYAPSLNVIGTHASLTFDGTTFATAEATFTGASASTYTVNVQTNGGASSMLVQNNSTGASAIGLNVLAASLGSPGINITSTGYYGLLSKNVTDLGSSAANANAIGIVGQSKQSNAAYIEQGGTSQTLERTNVYSALYVTRTILSLAGFDFTGPLLFVDDTTTSTGDLIRLDKSSAKKFAINYTGKVTTDLQFQTGTTTVIGTFDTQPLIITTDNTTRLTIGTTGTITIPGQVVSTLATGTAPFSVASTTKVANLNVDSLDDQSGSYYLDSANFTGTNWTDLTDGGTTTLHTHTSGIASTITVANEGTDTTCFPVFVTAATGDLGPKSNTSLTFNSNSGALGAVTLISTIATGTAPLTVSSTTRVTNLNAATCGNADTVTTNANLTGPITSTGNATAVAAQTGTGSVFVMQATPTLTTPVIGAATGTSVALTGTSTNVGNFGVGTTSTNVGGSAADIAVATVKGRATANGARIELVNAGTNGNDQVLGGLQFYDATALNADIYSARATAGDDAYIVVRTANAGSLTERMRISAAGLVTVASLTASRAVFTDGSKGLVSNAVTGTVNVVMSTSPTLTTPKATTTIGVGNATASASGSGITFPAAVDASTDANTLDDYEEGTFTPNVGGTATYTTQSGVYTKIGRTVHWKISFEINSLGSGSTTTLSGFPFTAASDSTAAAISIGYFGSLAVNVIHIGGAVQPATADCTFGSVTTSAATITNSIALFGNGARIDCAGTYNV